MKKTLFKNRKGNKECIDVSCKVNLNNYHHIFINITGNVEEEKLKAVSATFELNALEAGF